MATSNKNKTQAPQEENVQETAAATQEQVAKTPDPEVEALKAQVAALMAELKAVKEAAKEEPEETEDPELTETPEDEWEIYEEVYVPRHGRGQEPNFFISVNDRTVQIPADGKYHRMRRPFAEVLRMSIEAEAAAEKYADEVPHDAAPASFEQLMTVINDLKNKLKEHGID